MTVEDARLQCEKENFPFPSQLTEESESSRTRSDAADGGRLAEAPNLPAVSKPDPGPQATPQLKAAHSTNEAPPKQTRKPKKEPLKWEFEAYNLCKQGKWTQKVIAEMLARISSSH